jgi:hypothetical protein
LQLQVRVGGERPLSNELTQDLQLWQYYNGAFITMANERFGDSRYQKIGILTGLNYAMQCVSAVPSGLADASYPTQVGSIIIAPLMKRYPTRSVLSIGVLSFGLISAVVLVVDAGTGGKLKFNTSDNKTHCMFSHY